MYNLRILALILLATLLGYLTHLFIKNKINPRASAFSFLVYLIAHFATIVIWVFLFGLVLIRFKNWFLTK
ncbi:MAG TPA: hypothetical protein PLZ45_05920 [Ferruginibacter sp.]|nr:hypothetical protein [Ferruginibacter sp.]